MKDLLGSLGNAAALVALVAAPLLAFTALAGVSFSAPGALLLAGLALPLLLLHLLKSRRPRRVVASLAFWRGVAREQRAATPFRRLRRNLALLLLLLALGALSYGAARPVVQGHDREGRSFAIVLDASASMLARDHEGGARFDAARAAALELVARLGVRDEAMVVAVDRTAWTAVPWTEDQATLARGLRALEARHTSTALADALVLAASSCQAAAGRPEVHLLSDGGGPPPPPLSLPGGSFHYRSFGSSGENLGVVAIDVQPRVSGAGGAGPGGSAPARADGLTYEVFASVLNAGRSAREVFVRLEREEQLIDVRQLTLQAGETAPVVFQARLPPGPVSVRLAPTDRAQGRLDPLAVDDRAWALVPEERGAAVGLVSRDPSPALERALGAAGAAVRRLDPDALTDDPRLRLYVFEGVVPATLPPRDCLFIDPEGPVGPLVPGAPVATPRVGGWDREHPLLRYVDLRDVAPAVARPLALRGGSLEPGVPSSRASSRARVLLQGDDPATGEAAVLMASWEDGAAARTVVAFDVYASAWPLRVSFPIFMRNLLQAALERDHLAPGGVQAGTPVAIPVAADVAAVAVTDPRGEVTSVPARDGHAYFEGAHWTGVYTVAAGERTERFCVNLGDPEESRIEPRAEYALVGAEGGAAPAGERRRPVEVSFWFALLALGVLTLEGWVYHRRW